MNDAQARKARQRNERDKHLSDVEASLTQAAGAIEDSKRQIQRSRDIISEQRAENARQDRADDAKE